MYSQQQWHGQPWGQAAAGPAPAAPLPQPWQHHAPGQAGYRLGAPSSSLSAPLPPPPPATARPALAACAALPAVLAGGSLINEPQRAGPGWAPAAGAQRSRGAGGIAATAATHSMRQLNARIRSAETVEQVLSAATEGWQSLDCINLATALHRLGQLADAAGGGAGLRPELQRFPGVYAWLLDCLGAAAAHPDFSARCLANTLAALAKLDGFSAPLLRALRPPLLRALGAAGAPAATAAADRLNLQGLTQVLWAFGRDRCLDGLLPEAGPALFGALGAVAPALDAQGVVTAWRALGEVATRAPQALGLERAAPDLQPRLEAAAKATASGMSLQGLADVLLACTKLHGHAYRDTGLLQALAVAASHRLQSGAERPPPPAALARLAQGLAGLGYQPACYWCSGRGRFVSPLDDLCEGLDVCSLLGGLAQLGYSPPAPALHAVLAHLGAADRQQAQQPDPAVSGRLSRSGSQEGEVCSAAGCTTKVLELFSCQELAELVGALSRILQRGQYPPPALPPRTVSDFFDQLDTILGARARLARKIAGSPQLRAAEGRARLALSAAHVGGLCWALAGLPQATLTAATLRELEAHLVAFSSYYSASALANLLHLYASQGLQLGPQAAAAAAARALAVLQQEQQAVQARWEGPAAARAGGLPPLGFSLAALSKLMWAVAALGLSHPPLLESLLPALSAALAGEGEAARAGGGQPGGALVRQLARLAAALGQLLATGQLAAARLDSVPALEPLWRQLQELLECSAARAAQAGGPGAGLQLQDARAVQHAADALNHGLGRWGGGSPFQVAPCVQRCLG